MPPIATESSLCARCGTPFTPKRYHRKVQRFCSLACGRMARESRVLLVCRQCGGSFERKRYMADWYTLRGPFCGRACYANWQREHPAIKHADPTAREDRPARAAEYWVWLGLKRRCLNPAKEKDRQNYAERGITVCDRWRDSFQAFLADMGPRPGPEYSLDRIDNDGNYEPGNCHWATTIEQRHNQRRYLEAHHATCPARAQFQKARKAARP